MTKYYILLFFTVLTNVIAQILIKKGALLINLSSKNLKLIILQLTRNYFIFSGLFTYIISFILMIIVLSKINLNRVYPINFGLGFMLIIIFSHIFIGEKLTYNIIMGGLFIFLGIYIIIK